MNSPAHVQPMFSGSCLASSRILWRKGMAGITVGMLCWLAMMAPGTAQVHKLNVDEMSLFQKVSAHSEQERGTVTLDPILCIAARQRAADMARRNYFGHTDPDGQGPNYHVRLAGFELPPYYDNSRSGNNIESIGMATGQARDVFSQWLKSSAHRVHVLGELDFYKQQTSVGVGVFRSKKAPYYKYFVFLSAPPNVLATPRAATLKSPKGIILATTRPLAAAFASFTGTATR